MNTIFGILIGKYHCSIGDGDEKYQLKLRNFNYGTRLEELLNHLN